MRVKVSFPIDSVNRPAIRDQLLLDLDGSGVEKALFDAANAAKNSDQKVFVSRGLGRRRRLSVWIVDDTSDGSSRERSNALKEALARVSI